MRISQEEIFGPVLSVIPFDDEQDALRIANGTAYSLAAIENFTQPKAIWLALQQ